MYVFLDESGIHLKTGHSVFALVYIQPRDLPTIERAMNKLQANINTSSFHWKAMAWPVRNKAFTGIARLPFHFQIAVINNPAGNIDDVTAAVLGQLLVSKDQDIAAICIDGRKSHAYEARLKKSLRDSGIKSIKLKTVDDRAFPGVQLADLIAGVYRHQIDKPSPRSAALQALITKKQQ
jgi:hypothetical protein